jgi:hypothetical protein
MKPHSLSASLLLSLLGFSVSAQASILQCPRLTGKFFCKAVQGSHEDMLMTITEDRRETSMVYTYLYEQTGQKPFSLTFPACDQGVKNPQQDDEIGRCWRGAFFNSLDGKLTARTLLNYVNARGDYDVVRYGDHSLFLRCDRRK